MKNIEWNSFLVGQGAQISENGQLEFAHIQAEELATGDHENFIAPLTHQSLLSIQGVDVTKFLQGQLTCDVATLSIEQSLLGSACTPKGRMYTSFRLIELADTSPPCVLMRLRSDIAESTQAALNKYMVFFKSKMLDVSDSWAGMGIVGEHNSGLLSQIFGALPAKDNQVLQTDEGILIRVPGTKVRYEAWLKTSAAIELWHKLAADSCIAGTGAWRLEDMRAGIAEVSAATQEEFLPQALNFQIVGAVSFNKGCYTGQEIVARTQYRGKIKRFMLHGLLENAPPVTPGMELREASSQQSSAIIVEAVAINAHQQEVLMVVLDDLADQSSWQLALDEHLFSGVALKLPYKMETID